MRLILHVRGATASGSMTRTAGAMFFVRNCGAGDGFKLLQLVKGWSFKQAASEVEGPLPEPCRPARLSSCRATPLKSKPAAESWRESQAVVVGDPVPPVLCKTYRHRRGTGLHSPSCRSRLSSRPRQRNPAPSDDCQGSGRRRQRRSDPQNLFSQRWQTRPTCRSSRR